MSQSSVKRVFAKSDMPLSRIDEALRLLKMDFAELARKVADAQPLLRQLTAQQEAAVVPTVASCCSRSAASASGRSSDDEGVRL